MSEIPATHDSIGKLMEASILSEGFIDRLTILAIEFQAQTITADRFAKRAVEMLVAYQKKGMP